jgi:N-acetylglutamate synthase-like GNAT family acetyltransferase
MAIAIAPFEPSHVEGVATLIIPIQREEFGIPISYDDQPDLKDIPGFYMQGAGGFWLALDGDRVIGSIGLRDIGKGAAALRKMFVHTGYRGPEEGTAHRLLATLLDHARAKGLSTIYLGTTEKFRAAHRFYEKHGFSLVDTAELPESFPRMAVDTRFYRLVL